VPLNRRELLVRSGAAAAACALGLDGMAAPSATRCALGVVEHSFGNRLSSDRNHGGPNRVDNPLGFLEYCAKLGAGGIQMTLGGGDSAYFARVRERAEALSMFIEGSIRAPRDKNDLPRFEGELRAAKECGATVVRTAMLSGRRYETFNRAASFREFKEFAHRSLSFAEPIAARLRMKLAVENHKDFRVDELLELIKRIDSAHVGVCLDTGNSIALLEQPRDVVHALAPFAFSTHLKDMGVEEYPDGFLLSEVPFGEGFLDISSIAREVQEAHPETHLVLEMITRDPLKIPCLTEKYWLSFEKVPALDLVHSLKMVREHVPKRPLPRVSQLSAADRLRVEEDNVRRCIEFAMAGGWTVKS
jgi:sugar phosphate isomerase/epimerase